MSNDQSMGTDKVDCPACGGNGWIVIPARCEPISREQAMDAGDPAMEGHMWTWAGERQEPCAECQGTGALTIHADSGATTGGQGQ